MAQESDTLQARSWPLRWSNASGVGLLLIPRATAVELKTNSSRPKCSLSRIVFPLRQQWLGFEKPGHFLGVS